MVDFTIFYDSNINLNEVNAICSALSSEYRIVNIIKRTPLELINHAYSEHRQQYDGQILLNYLIEVKKFRFFIWLVSDDLYVPVMNFVFGLASHYYGALVSFYRLPDLKMKIKESIHECGHVLGLEHCENECVMQYSNSLSEALKKPSNLCLDCINKLTSVSSF